MGRYVFKLDGVDVCDIALDSARLVLGAGGPDSLSLTYAADPTGTAPHAHGDTLTLTCLTYDDEDELTATETLFKGRVKRVNRADNGPSGGFAVEARNGWDDLRRIILTQAWKSAAATTGTLSTVNVPRVLLGMDDDGSTMTTGEVLDWIIDHADAKGALVTAGTISPNLEFPPTEVADTTADAAFRQVLRYHPDHVAWIEDGEMVHVQAPADLVEVTVASSCAAGMLVSVAPASEDVPSGVRITWEKTHNVDGQQLIERIQQTAGTVSGTPWPPPLEMTIPLAGVNITYKKQLIETRTLPVPGSTSATAAKKFFRGLIPQLEDAADADLRIASYAVAFADPLLDDLAEDGSTVNPHAKPLSHGSATTADFPRQLVSGQIQDWMPGNLKQYDAILTARLYYSGSDAAVRKFIGDGLDVSEPIVITNALPKEYSEIDTYEAGESPIDGLAASYWAAIQTARQEGSVSGDLRGEWLDIRPGRKVTITDHAITSAVVTRTQYDLLGMTFSATFGGSEYLNPKTTVELARAAARNRPTWRKPEERTEAKTGSDSGVLAQGAKATFYGGPKTDKIKSGPWSLQVQDPATNSVKVRLGTIIHDLNDVTTKITIASGTSSFTVSSGDFLYLETAGWAAPGESEEMTVTLKKGSSWGTDAAWSTTGSGATTAFDKYFYPLWKFSSTDGGEEWEKVTDNLYALRLAESSHFSVEHVAYQNGTDHAILVPKFIASHRAIP